MFNNKYISEIMLLPYFILLTVLFYGLHSIFKKDIYLFMLPVSMLIVFILHLFNKKEVN